MARGKGKGSNFEREICRALSKWVSGGKEEDCFWRSAMSGGRATRGKQKSGGKGFDNCAGDITCTGAAGLQLTKHFVVECKFYTDLEIHRFLFDNEPAKWLEWFNKLLGECGECRQPLLIAKQNHQQPLCFTSPQGFKLLALCGPLRKTGTVYHNRITPFEVFPLAALVRLDFRKAKQWKL